MTYRAIAATMILLSALITATGCHQIHRDYHRWQNDRYYDGDRDDRRHYRDAYPRRRWWWRH